ncbi:HSF-type DNA-binding domain containing protein, partial [Aphelenchoides avenae]
MAYQQQQPVNGSLKMQPEPYILKEDEKIPLFLIKLWNIVEDPAYYDVIRWDESGYSFHIMDPYSFCRNVLPQYFKHNNLNSLIRQLNMYGFRKMTPIERTSLARAESDQDHLEFSHPYFVRDHPEQLVNIKRKAPASRQHHDQNTVSIPAKDLNAVFEELRGLRERQKSMESKMGEIVKENEMIWNEMSHMRGQHNRQTQIVNKLVQFLVALVQPRDRLGKRHLYAIDEVQSKRSRPDGSSGSSMQTFQPPIQTNNLNEVLDRLMNELASGGLFHNGAQLVPFHEQAQGGGPIIADVTDELEAMANANPNASGNQRPPEYFVEQPNGASHQSRRKAPHKASYVQQQPPATAPYYQQQGVPVTVTPQRPLGNMGAQAVAQTPIAPQNVSRHILQAHRHYQQPQQKKPVTSPQPQQHINYPLVPAQPQQPPSMQVNQMPVYVPQPAQPQPPMMDPQQMPPTSMPAGVAGLAPEDPLIHSPASCGGLSIGDFADYLNGMDTDIDKCRDLIGGT